MTRLLTAEESAYLGAAVPYDRSIHLAPSQASGLLLFVVRTPNTTASLGSHAHCQRRKRKLELRPMKYGPPVPNGAHEAT